MADEDKEKTSEDVTEEEQHHEPEAAQPEPDEDNEDECDEAIAGLIATIDALDARVAELESKLEQHGIEFEHTRRAEGGDAPGAESTPEERHFYFRRLGKH